MGEPFVGQIVGLGDGRENGTALTIIESVKDADGSGARRGDRVAVFPAPEGYVTIASVADAFPAELLRDALRLKTGEG